MHKHKCLQTASHNTPALFYIELMMIQRGTLSQCTELVANEGNLHVFYSSSRLIEQHKIPVDCPVLHPYNGDVNRREVQDLKALRQMRCGLCKSTREASLILCTASVAQAQFADNSLCIRHKY